MSTISNAWRHIRRSPYQAIAAIITLFLTLLLTGIFLITSATSVLILRHFEGKPQLTIFFTDEATEANIQSLQKQLEDTGKIAEITYVSKEQALEIYREQNKNDPLLLEMVTADILPASLEVSTVEPKYLSELEPQLQGIEEIEEVVYQRDVVDTLIAWTNATRLVVGTLATLLIIDAILIIITITSMKIALKREEIEILRLVGASRWYIRLPFVWEAGMYGMTGAFGAWMVITATLLYTRSTLLAFLGIIPEIEIMLSDPTGPFFLLASSAFLGAMLLVGFMLSAFGSLISVNRFLKI